MISPRFSPVHQVCSMEPGAHFVQIYESNESLIDCVFAFFQKGFNAREVALVIATSAHRTALEGKMVVAGYDVLELKRSGKYFPVDAAETLGLFMHKGQPEACRFNALVGGLIKSAIKHGSGVRAFGEMVSILWDEGNREGALELEQLWNDLAKEHAFSLFCGYRQNQFSTKEDRAAFSSVCHAHSSVVGASIFQGDPALQSTSGDSD